MDAERGIIWINKGERRTWIHVVIIGHALLLLTVPGQTLQRRVLFMTNLWLDDASLNQCMFWMQIFVIYGPHKCRVINGDSIVCEQLVEV